MTPNEIRNARRSLGMTLRQFAAALGVKEHTARRWEMDASRSSHRVPSAAKVRVIGEMIETTAPCAQGE